MMDNMMKSMIRNMSIEEREAMMLKMMPQMVKQADLKILAPNMLTEVGKNISLFGLYDLLAKLVKDEKISSSIANKAKELLGSMPKIMSSMMPLMMDMMKGFMPKMMGFMMPMMPEMMTSCKSSMSDMMETCEPEMKEYMAACMQQMMPHCVDHMFPALAGKDKPIFALGMINTFSAKAIEGMEASDKQNFAKMAIEEIKQTTATNNKEE